MDYDEYRLLVMTIRERRIMDAVERLSIIMGTPNWDSFIRDSLSILDDNDISRIVCDPIDLLVRYTVHRDTPMDNGRMIWYDGNHKKEVG